jgi:hypothetical protein
MLEHTVRHKSAIPFIPLEERKEALRQMAIAVLSVGRNVELVESFEKHAACSFFIASILDLFYCTKLRPSTFYSTLKAAGGKLWVKRIKVTPIIMADIFLLVNRQAIRCKYT